MTIYWRCSMCDPKLYRPHAVEVPGNDPPISLCQRAVYWDHADKFPDCPASRPGLFNAVNVDFYLRMVM